MNLFLILNLGRRRLARLYFEYDTSSAKLMRGNRGRRVERVAANESEELLSLVPIEKRSAGEGEAQGRQVAHDRAHEYTPLGSGRNRHIFDKIFLFRVSGVLDDEHFIQLLRRRRFLRGRLPSQVL